MRGEKCAIWGTDLISWACTSQENLIEECNSPRAGGKYRAPMHIANILRVHDDTFKAKLTSWLVERRMSGDEAPMISESVVNELIDQRSLISTSERLRRFFIYCSLYKNRLGDKVFDAYSDWQSTGVLSVDQSQEIAMAYSEIIDRGELNVFLRLLHGFGYLDDYELTYKAFERIDELSNRSANFTQAFVAMWFDPSLNDSYENAIEPAIREAGYEPRIIRKVEHNNKIDDEIIAEIRRSKFVIADFTCGFSKDGSEAIARGGVYYEAGFAQGLGLPVIWTCREDIISHVHFDTRQYNHIVWKDTADLKEKLLNRIRATII